MVKFLIVVLLFSVFGNFIISCYEDSHSSHTCTEDIFNNKIPFGKYYSDKNILINYKERTFWDLLYYPYDSIDSSQYSIYELFLQEDSSFSYLKIFHQKDKGGIVIDTTMMLNGNFKITKDVGLPWYVFELNSDYIYEKTVNYSLDGILYFTDFSENEFKGFEDIFFTSMHRDERTKVDKYKYNHVTDNCFTLYMKSNCMSNNVDYPCSHKYEDCYWEIFRSKTFCLQQPEETQIDFEGTRQEVLF